MKLLSQHKDKMRNVTVIFIFLVIIAIAVFDVFAVYNGGTESTISHVLIGWSYEFPSFTFAMGFTMGHLFWKIRDIKKNLKE